MTIRLVVFDKDGTLISWNVWDAVIAAVLDEFIADELRTEAAVAIEFDLERGRVLAGSPVIGGSNGEVIELLFPFAADEDSAAFHHLVEARFVELANDHVSEQEGASELLAHARSIGISVALCTNDSVAAARAQVDKLGWTDLIPHVFGYDSGHGGKPGPGMLLAALTAAGCLESEALMVGDSDADVTAAERAGMRCVYIGDDPVLRARTDLCITRLADLPPLLAD